MERHIKTRLGWAYIGNKPENYPNHTYVREYPADKIVEHEILLTDEPQYLSGRTPGYAALFERKNGLWSSGLGAQFRKEDSRSLRIQVATVLEREHSFCIGIEFAQEIIEAIAASLKQSPSLSSGTLHINRAFLHLADSGAYSFSTLCRCWAGTIIQSKI